MEEELVQRPIPRPRRTIGNNKTDTSDTIIKYENVTADIINKNIEIKEKNIESDSSLKLKNNINVLRTAEEVTNPYRNVITELNNLNLDRNKNVPEQKSINVESPKVNDITDDDNKRPVPAPRRPAGSSVETKHNAVNSGTRSGQDVTDKSTGAIRKKIVIKNTSDNAIELTATPKSRRYSDKDERQHNKKKEAEEEHQYGNLRKTQSSNILNSNSSTSSAENIPQYKTSSPGDLLKSIGATSRLLTESITERVSLKSKSAKHKIDKNLKSSKEKFSNWGTETSYKLKNVRNRLHSIGTNNLSLGRSNKKTSKFDPDRPQTLPPSDEIFQSIQFNSPLNIKTENCQDLTIVEPSYSIVPNRPNISSDKNSSGNDKCPSYEDVIKPENNSLNDSNSSLSLNTSGSGNVFERNTKITQSMMSSVGGRGQLLSPKLSVSRIKSDSNLYENVILENKLSDKSDDSSSVESLPCPKYPPPIFQMPDSIYGKVKQNSIKDYSSTESESPANYVPIRTKRRKDHEPSNLKIRETNYSNRATVDSNELAEVEENLDFYPRIFSRQIDHPPADLEQSSSTDSKKKTNIKERRFFSSENKDNNPTRSDSWSFYDVTHEETCSSPEPIYSNDEPVYGRLYEMESKKNSPKNKKPVKIEPIARTIATENKPSTSSNIVEPQKELIEEFDPLIAKKVDQIFSNKSNQLILLESLLAEETYGSIDDENITDDQSLSYSDDENSSIDSNNIPTPPERSDSLQNIQTSKPPQSSTSATSSSTVPQSSSEANNINRTTSLEHKTLIIHQNIKLHSGSLENIVDETEIERYLTQNDDSKQVALDTSVDLSVPTASRSNWFIDDADVARKKYVKNQKIDPVNKNDSKKPVDKIVKSVPKLVAVTTPPSTSSGINEKPPALHVALEPPSYNEAIGATGLTMNTSPSSTGTKESQKSSPIPQPKNSPNLSMKSMLTSVLNKGRNINLKRKNSLKNGSKPDLVTVLEMIPKPTLSYRNICLDGHLIRLPSGVVEDILKEHQSRHVMLRDRKFQTFLDSAQKQPKENFPLEYITTIQSVLNHKYTNSTTEIYCFEITTAIPKHQPTNQLLSNPNMVMTTTNCGNNKTQRVCHVYGVVKQSERNIWMQKLLESMTNVFPSSATCEYKRTGWCYLKTSISSEWSGSWILLQRRKLYFYSVSEKKLDVMDLRKARCIVLKEADESINNLHVESGPTMMIDCPPYTVYFIMNSPRETKIWRHILKEEAQNNGSSLKSQQLTKENVPVLVDKCINFIYAHGSMSEGIYRKSGSEQAILRLLGLFRTDAFSVQITRNEYSEHDVANVLKRFMRDLPERLLGKHTVSFVSVSHIKSTKDKLESYKELLLRLPTIESQTLRKLLGHLYFIQSQKTRNKMSIDNLGILWGPTLMQDKSADEMNYSQSEANVMMELIAYYKNLYHPTADEVEKEKIMLTVLQKYHAAAENLSDTVKKSGDLKVWIIIDTDADNKTTDEKTSVQVSLTPTKTAYEVCKELAPKLKMEPHNLTLSEMILNGEMSRPLHYNENVLDTVLRWTYWQESDRKHNWLEVKPTKFLFQVERALKNLPTVTPNTELKYADCKTKALKALTLELFDSKITVYKKEKQVDVKQKEIELNKIIAYLGCEKKRELQLRWTITLIEKDFKKRSRDSPFIGHVIAGTNSNDQIVWYSSILHCLYKTDILPNPEIVLT